MLEPQFVRTLLCLVLVVGLSATGAMGADILYVTADPGNPDEALISDFLEGLGHTVTLIDDDADEPAMEVAAAAADLVYISESVGSSKVRDKITEIETPMIISESWAWDEMGLTHGGGGGADVASTDITIVDPDHFLAAGLSGTVPVLTEVTEVGPARFAKGLAGTSATVIATAELSDDGAYDVLFVYEKGAPLAVAPADGSPAVAADIRICIPFDTRSEPVLNENAFQLLAAAVNYALGITDQARAPRPRSGTKDVTTSLLQWSAGETANWHNVYLGTNPTPGPAELLSERQMGPTYQITDDLIPNVTYYWRIDEVEADETTVHTGIVWSFSTALLTASGPDPSDGTTFVDPSVTLGWVPGFGAATHSVYLGTNKTAVLDATVSSGEFQGNQAGTVYGPELLAKGATYYWRIDEVEAEADGATTHKGDIWSFSTVPDITIRDPNLLGWWMLDDDGSGMVTDYSGYSHHGTFVRDPQWAEGVYGDALQFDGTNYVELPAGLASTEKGSVCLWIKTAQTDIGMVFYGAEGTGGDGFGGENELHINIQDNVARFFLEGGDASDTNVRTAAVNDDAWHHITGTWDAEGDLILYVDAGAPVSASHNGNRFILEGRTRLGRPNSDKRYYIGSLDDVRLYDYVLSPDEIATVMKGDPRLASAPSPDDRSVSDVERATPLTWVPGEDATGHHVYFGTDRDAVANADSFDTSGTYRGLQDLDAASYAPPEALAFGQTYYWRIDELDADATVSEGRVWSFAVADYLIVDGFEDYTDDIDAGEAIFQTWIDGWENGTGSTVGYFEAIGETFGERTIVHSGDQSMPLDYNNVNSPWYSETDRTWAIPQDWTRHGVTALVVHFKGNPPAFLESSPGNIAMSAAGVDIFGVADEFRFVHRPLNGNGSIVARVDGIEGIDPWAKGGVMIRDTIDPGSRFAAVYITPGNGCRFQGRRLTNGLAISDSDVATAEQMAINAPYWIKLERTGDQFNGSYSADGVNWTPMVWNPQTIAMTGNVYIGLALTSHSPDSVCTAEFSMVSATAAVSGAWQVTEIGIDHPDNSPEPLYMGLADSAGREVVVSHPDGPTAVQIGAWSAWLTDLAEFSDRGVDLTSIKKMIIGVGDRTNPAPGGLGQLFVDDIWLLRSWPSGDSATGE